MPTTWLNLLYGTAFNAQIALSARAFRPSSSISLATFDPRLRGAYLMFRVATLNTRVAQELLRTTTIWA